MAYRRLDITLPENDETDLAELCPKVRFIELVTSDALDGRRLVSAVVPVDQAEKVLTTLQEKFEGEEQFRATMVEVLGIVPTPKAPDEDEDASASGGGDKQEKNAKGRISRDELLTDLLPGTRCDRVYLLLVGLSTVIAATGLVRDNAAVVIGAMVIAPLLLPNMSMALGTTLGDLPMILRSVRTNVLGLGLALGLSAGSALLLAVDVGVSEIQSRTVVGLSDVLLALSAGAAGALAVTSGVSANMIGVMVAVALLPPWVATGLLLGEGQWGLASRAGLLTAVNLSCVNLSAVITFFLRGIQPSRWYENSRARRATALAVATWSLAVLLTALLIWLAQPIRG